MAKKSATNSLAAKLGSKGAKAVKAHASDETKMGIVDIPGGIKNGVAKLVECKFDQYKKGNNEGEFYFLAAGIIQDNYSNLDNIPTKGLRTQIMIPVCDTKTQAGKETSVEDHIANILNEMRKLGLETEDAELENMEEMASDLKEAAPYFRFSTTQSAATAQFPNPRVWENWNGVLEDYEPEDNDEVDEEDDDEEEVEEKPTKSSKGRKPKAAVVEEESEEESETEEEDDDEENDDEESEEESDDDDDNDDNDDDDDDDEEEETIVPEKGDECEYKEKGKRKPVTVTVTAVNEKKETCSVKDEAGKLHKEVSFDDLIWED
jgi:hypothetical protein